MVERIDHIHDLFVGITCVFHVADEELGRVLAEEQLIQRIGSVDPLKAGKKIVRAGVSHRALRKVFPGIKFGTAFHDEAGRKVFVRIYPLLFGNVLPVGQMTIYESHISFPLSIDESIDEVCQFVHNGLICRFRLIEDAVSENTDLVAPGAELAGVLG